MLDAAGQLAEQWPCKAEALLKALGEELSWIKSFGETLPALKDSFFKEQIENFAFTLEEIKGSLGQTDVPGMVLWQLPCFLRELREELYFWAYIHPFPERWSEYYQSEFAQHHKNTAADFQNSKYKVSIFIPAKDKLEYTRRCVESVLRETDRAQIPYELILINHGSQDETQSYFESIEGAKLLHFKCNVRMMMFSAALRVCEGRYMAFVSNDTVVTKDWLDLLCRCIQSDPTIISATPITPNSSNYQSIAESYTNLEEMQQFAAGYNHHDPAEWEHRSRVLPVIALYDLEKLNTIGFADRYFRTMEFWDDDLSLRARRGGYRQILCRNVFCHHYGSVTGKEAQIKENTLQKGRELFIAKHHADPWGNGAYYDYPICARLKTMDLPTDRTAAILGVDAGFGDTLLQIGNILRKKAIGATVDSITAEAEYIEDLRAISRVFSGAKNEEHMLALLTEEFHDETYEYIYLAKPLEHYKDWKELLSRLCGKLKPGGILLFYLSNALNLVNLQWFGALAFPPGKERLNYLNPQQVGLYLRQKPMTITVERSRGWAAAPLLEQVAARAQSAGGSAEILTQIIDTVGFYYYARKNELP